MWSIGMADQGRSHQISSSQAENEWSVWAWHLLFHTRSVHVLGGSGDMRFRKFWMFKPFESVFGAFLRVIWMSRWQVLS